MELNDGSKLKEEIIKATDERESIIEDLPENDMADEIYIFIPSKQFGIRFYSRSPRSALRTGVFQTDIHSISRVEWNEHVNSKKEPTVFDYVDGQVITSTYIVSEQSFLRILDEINKQKTERRITVNITGNDLSQDLNSIDNKKDDREMLERMKRELLNIVSGNNEYSNASDKAHYEPFMNDSDEPNRIVR